MTTLPLAEVRARLSQLVEEASSTHHERVEITRNSVRTAVLLSSQDYDSLLETLDVLADAKVVQSLRESLGASETSTLDEVREAMRAAGRLRA